MNDKQYLKSSAEHLDNSEELGASALLLIIFISMVFGVFFGIFIAPWILG